MPTTPRLALPYPAPGTPPDGPFAFQQLAERVEAVTAELAHTGAVIAGAAPTSASRPVVRTIRHAQTTTAGGAFAVPVPAGLSGIASVQITPLSGCAFAPLAGAQSLASLAGIAFAAGGAVSATTAVVLTVTVTGWTG